VKQSVTQDSTKREYIQCLYSAMSGHTRSAQTWIIQFYLQITPCLPFCFASVHQMAPLLSEVEGIWWGPCHSFIDPEGMKGWVGLHNFLQQPLLLGYLHSLYTRVATRGSTIAQRGPCRNTHGSPSRSIHIAVTKRNWSELLLDMLRITKSYLSSVQFLRQGGKRAVL